MQPGHLILPTYRADIDGLRALAVVAVIGFHAFPEQVPGGFIGVDVFFVVSGFLISSIIFESLARGSFSFAEFYRRRIRRIFPALLLVLSASLVCGWFVLLPDEYARLGKHVAGGAGFVSNFLLQNEGGYFDGAAHSKPLLHLWSLAIEEQFYIAWPLLLWLAWKRRSSALKVVAVIGVASFALNIGLSHIDPIAAFYAPQARFWELFAGSALAYATLFRQDALARFERGSDARSLIGAAFMVAGLLLTTKEQPFPGWLAVLPTAGTALVISAGPQAWLNRRVLANPLLVWIGLISYPLYLWHWLSLSFASIVQGETPAWQARVAAVAVSIALAWLTYRLVERPMRFGNHRHGKAIAVAILMLAVGCAGYEVHRRDGMPARFPEIVQQLSRHTQDAANRYRAGSCLLHLYQDQSAFDACKTAPAKADGASILLWGDSHAAHLYAGYLNAFGEKFALVQRTAANCPPILDLDIDKRPNCRAINAYVLELIRQEKPDRVVLAAAWGIYDWQRVERTVTQLRNIGVAGIDLIGPVPHWNDSLPKQLYLHFRKFHEVPERMNSGLNRNFLRLDREMSEFARTLGVNYLSPAGILCNEAGCITKTGQSIDSLTAWDYAHLTDAGARFLVSKLPGARN